jgi:hypothetical protein
MFSMNSATATISGMMRSRVMNAIRQDREAA